MAIKNKIDLKTWIENHIYTNNNEEISGKDVQTGFVDFIDSIYKQLDNIPSGVPIIEGVLDRKVDLVATQSTSMQDLDNLEDGSLFWDRYAQFYDTLNPIALNLSNDYEKPRFIYFKQSGSWNIFRITSKINVRYLGLEPVPKDIDQYYDDEKELNKQINYLYKNPNALDTNDWDTSGIDENLMQDIIDFAYEGGSGRVYFPSGYYLVGRTKFIYDGMTIEGDGFFNTEFRTYWLDDHSITLDSSTGAKTDRFYLGNGNYHLGPVSSVGNTDGENYYQGITGTEPKDADVGIFSSTYRPLKRREYINNGQAIVHTTIEGAIFRDFAAKTNSINRSDDGVFRFDGIGGPCSDNTFYNLNLHDVGGNGFYIYRCVTTTFNSILVERCANSGFLLYISTSVTFLSCYCNSCLIKGYDLVSGNYTNLSGCAADSCGKAYNLENCNSINLSGCGAESVRLIANDSLIQNKTSGDLDQPNSEYATVPGIALDISDSQGITVDAFYLFRVSRGVYDSSGNIATDFPYTRFCRVIGSENIVMNNPVIKSVNRYRYNDNKWELENDMLDAIFELRNSPDFKVFNPSYDTWDRTPNVYLDDNGDLRRFLDDNVLINDKGTVQGTQAGEIIPIDSSGSFIDGDESMWVNQDQPIPYNTRFNQNTSIFSYSNFWAWERVSHGEYGANVSNSRLPNTRKYLNENNSWKPVKFSPYWTDYNNVDIFNTIYPYFKETSKSYNVTDIDAIKDLGIATESDYIGLTSGFNAHNYEILPDDSVNTPADQIALVENGYNILYITERHLNKVISYRGYNDLYVRIRKNPAKVVSEGGTVQSENRDIFNRGNAIKFIQKNSGRIYIDHNTTTDKDNGLVTSSNNPYEAIDSLASNTLYTAKIQDYFIIYHKGGGYWVGEPTESTDIQFFNETDKALSNLEHDYKTDIKIGASAANTYLLYAKARGDGEVNLPFPQKIVNQRDDELHIGYDTAASNVPEIYSDSLIFTKDISVDGGTTNVKGVAIPPYSVAYIYKTLHNTDTYYITGDTDKNLTEDYYDNDLYPEHAGKVVRSYSSFDIDCSVITSRIDTQKVEPNFHCTLILEGSGQKRIDITNHNSVIAAEVIPDTNGVDVYTDTNDPAVVEVYMKYDAGSGSYDVYLSGDIKTKLTQEEVEDFAFNRTISNGTQDLINVGYNDSNNALNFAVQSDLSQYDNSIAKFVDTAGTALSKSGTTLALDANLSSLNDVFVSGSVSGQVLKYNGSIYTNQDILKADLPGVIAYEDESNTFSQSQTLQSDLTVQGDIYHQGSVWQTEAETVEIKDNFGLLNFGETNAGITAGYSGWEIDRGTENPYRWGFEESSDLWKFGVYYTDLNYSNLSGSFNLHEQIVGNSSGASAYVVNNDIGTLRLKGKTSNFNNSETITGQDSGATATVDSTSITDNLVAAAGREDSPNNGSVAFWDNTNNIFKTTSNLYWDTNNQQLGINTNSPQENLGVDKAIQVGNQGGSDLLLKGDLGTAITNDDRPAVISSSDGGNLYPFNSYGHLVIQPRTSNLSDIVFRVDNKNLIEITGEQYIKLGDYGSLNALEVHGNTFIFGSKSLGVGDKDWYVDGLKGSGTKWEFYRESSTASMLIHQNDGSSNALLHLRKGSDDLKLINIGDKLVYEFDNTVIANLSDNGKFTAGDLFSNGSLGTNVELFSSSNTVPLHRHTILGDTSGGDVTLTLQPAGDVEGQILIFKKIASANNLVIEGDGSETIDGSASYTLTNNNESILIQSYGSEWFILANY